MSRHSIEFAGARHRMEISQYRKDIETANPNADDSVRDRDKLSELCSTGQPRRLSLHDLGAVDLWALRHQLHQVTSHAGGVVARHPVLFQVVAENWNHAQGFDRFQIVHYLAGAFARILFFQLFGSGSSVDQGEVENLFLRVAVQGTNVVCGG